MLRRIGKINWLRLWGLIFLVSCSLAFSEDIMLNVNVSSKTIPINQTFQYTISIDGNYDLPGVNLPALNDFTVLGQSSSTQIQIINGRQSSSKSYIFTLQPKKQGRNIIPGLKFSYKNNVYKTESVEIDVSAYVTPNQTAQAQRYNPFSIFEEESPFTVIQQQAQNGQQVYVETIPHKKNLYPGEKTLVDFKLYFDRGFYQGPVYNQPKMSGFVVKYLNNSDKPVAVEYKNRKMNLLKNTQIIYPLQPGKYDIGAAQVQYIDSPFGGIKTLSTTPYSITVQKLPQPQPEQFSGAVGKFDLNVEFAPKKIVNAGEVIPLLITISGKGNLDMVNELDILVSSNINKYLEGVDNKQTYALSAKRTYKYFLTPVESGTISLGEFSFCYFDPQQRAYKYLNYKFPEIKVKGSISGKVAGTSSGTVGQGINISVDKELFVNIVRVIFKVVSILIGMLIIVIAGYLLYTRVLSPIRKLKIKFLQVQNLKEDAFIRESHDILRSLVKTKYKVNLSGLPINEISNKLKDPQISSIIIDLEKKYEELKYNGVQILSEEYKRSIIESIWRIF